MENYDKLVNEIKSCDLIVYKEIKQGHRYQYIGFHYDKNTMYAPSVVCKYSHKDCISMILFWIIFAKEEPYTVEDEGLTEELFEKLSPGDCIPKEYFDTFGKLYGEIKNRRKNRENWDLRARKYSDILKQVNLMKIEKYKRAEKSFIKKTDISKKKCIRNPIKKFENGTRSLSDKYNLELFVGGFFFDVWTGGLAQWPSKEDDYRLTGCFIELNLHILISPNEKKIYVYDNSLLRSFDFSETQIAFGYFETLVRAASTNVRKTAIKYCNEHIKQFPPFTSIKNLSSSIDLD